MVKKNILYPAVAVLVLLSLGWFLWPSDRQAIQKQLKVFTELSRKKTPEQGVEALTRAAGIADLVTDPCRIVSEEYGKEVDLDKKSVINQVLFIRNQSKTLHITFHDTTITLGEDDTAKVTATVRVETQGADDLFRDIREVSLNLKKHEGDWLIARVTLVQVLVN